ncbi:small oligopeptide transporter [Leucogyrophana mollusca]|uniref:Small oligopeptide transporter n=1 Tax=Leucogyrophana mollusca TaxID=85980 RepID=A0ACB8BSB5_9AGAM|nr:small oligopeptide transporter [Leucogyrophana mollusca]
MSQDDLPVKGEPLQLDKEKGEDIVVTSTLSDSTFDDPNIDLDAEILEDDSPYPEVRSAVANTDDPEMVVASFRTWVIGLLWAILIPGLNQFFFFRYPAITISSLVAQLLSFPVGRLWAWIVPRKTVIGISLNPGPFTVKEHVLVTVMATVGAMSAYATDIVAVQRVYYSQRNSFSYQWMLVMSTQLIGFSIGGVARRFLVSPPAMIWPANLVTCSLFNTLHSQQYAGIGGQGGISRERFFIYAFVASMCWHFFPGYIFTALSTFSWVTWIAPENIVINQLFGYASGLGMSTVTFDWSQIAYLTSPLATPWWAEANIIVGFVFIMWFVTPILHYSNIWYSNFLPMSSRSSYDNTGAIYNVTRILNPDVTFNAEAYHKYSPLFLSTTFALNYGIGFASITATIVHAVLYFRKQIWEQARRSLKEQPDIHARLMSRYREVPDWWYAIIFAVMFVFGAVCIEVWHTQMPIWGFVLALCISFAYVVPIGMIQAITNQQIGLNVIGELVVGYVLPGRPIAMMLFKTYGYITMTQALQFTSDFKLGHYMKIPPRQMFWSQVVATVVAGTTQLGVQSWMFTNIEDMCSPQQKDGFVCPNTEVFGTASVIWGVIGPALQFSKGQLYYALLWFFLLGAILPIIPWFLARRYPKTIFKYVNIPVILSGTGFIPPATAENYIPWAIFGFIFQHVIRRRHFSWWAKYNYVLSAALDSGVAVAIVLIFFCLEYPRNGTIGQGAFAGWWGNTVYTRTADWRGARVLRVPEGGTFGPAVW